MRRNCSDRDVLDLWRSEYGLFRPVTLGLVLGLLLSSPAAADGPMVDRSYELNYSSELLMSQGGIDITHADLDAFMRTVPEEDRAAFLSDPERIGRLLSNLVTAEAIFKEAVDEGFLEDPVYRASLYRQLADEASKVFRQRFVQSIELEDYTARARELYLSNPDRFQSDKTVNFYHVLIADDEARSDLEGMRLAIEAYDSYAQQGESIQDLVDQYSEDPSKEDNNGLFTEVPLEALEKPVRDLLRDLEPGTVSKPVRTRYGWHIVQLVELHEPTTLSWEEAKDRAIEAARSQHIALAIERKLREYHAESPEFPAGAIEKVLNRYDASFDRGVDSDAVLDSVKRTQND
jgi:parvulin-like peptidyl-prolyl isomerase